MKTNKNMLISVIVSFVLLSGCNNGAQTSTIQPSKQPNTVSDAANAAVESLPPSTISASPSGTSDPAIPSTTDDFSKSQYSILTATYTQDKISIQYPQITDLGDDQREKAINDLIKEDILFRAVEEPSKNFSEIDRDRI